MAYYPPHNQLPQEPPANMSYNQQWQPVEHSGPPALLPAVCQFTMLCVKCAHQTVYHLIPVAAGQPALQNSAAAGQLLHCPTTTKIPPAQVIRHRPTTIKMPPAQVIQHRPTTSKIPPPQAKASEASGLG
ncbi:hypothetical protein pipiens_017723 [Culex pipiens pipiens]|uniref:Uncharacterized protein n=1 Tax=Culex pipiens pipiens TaxID=38569 RepID=A0ABD1CF88_CULPP